MRYILLFLMVTSSLWAITPDEALQQLKIGNQHFMDDVFRPKDLSYTRRMLISNQEPFCAILTCSDSRVDPGFIFDKNLGDLFVIRLAGNVASPVAMESIDYAAIVLKVPLLIVMGHENCGAIDAILQSKAPPELVPEIAALVDPYISRERTLKESIIDNAKGQASLLKQHPILQKALKEGTLKVVAAYYDFSTGKVDFFE